MGRDAYARAILGKDLFAQLGNTRVLLVGAGGIGCELLKTLLLTGFGHITILDLDTIDLSNLNRQFLFRKKDVKQPKALVAADTAGSFNPACTIEPIHADIFEPRFDLAWFSGFDIVLNALDNMAARLHVNRMCIAANVPLVESGTAGYMGQVQPIVKDRTECFACLPKDTPKTFPVCTIRSTPSTPVHCIVWAKTYLFSKLFGESEDDDAEFAEALKNGENPTEIAELRVEAAAFSAIRSSLSSPNAPSLVFDKIYNADINRLLGMEDMWKSRTPPVPLDYTAIRARSFVLPERKKPGTVKTTNASTNSKALVNKTVNGLKNGKREANGSPDSASGLKDRKELSLEDNVELFASSVQRLAARQASTSQPLSFDKDDDDALDFVTATANLRAICYGIPTKTRWEVKEMAGNIIPAIATTNAMISGMIVLQALHLLKKAYHLIRSVYVRKKPHSPLGTSTMVPPNPYCAICKDVYVPFPCNPEIAILGDVLRAVGVAKAEDEDDDDDEDMNRTENEKELREAYVYEGNRLLFEPEMGENAKKTLAYMGVTWGKSLIVTDYEGKVVNLVLVLLPLPPDQGDIKPFVVPAQLPPLPSRVLPPVPSEPLTPAKSLKRSAPEDEGEVDDTRAIKRIRTEGGAVKAPTGKETNFREENGVLILDDDEDDNVIQLD
ncbi:hypothetical protein DACRYDRAFT_117842 [Dacryopinax primogenitus]|uniref:Ubiquitin-activating enzyme E1-like n=1 Tax=Dacryopinax primogenitus (strain DJM 731) TaxID=1858805 RepID=M5FRB4_DACPD|nr:uncharacterized protein DACRYDRAFT_117842 [Dacryopinax primogenitus]EJT99645.1 hypothetical protein DACRYDRAFT_117842 [Dacryopinax primogenitus]